MKLPKVRQLKSGSYYCRVRINGSDISITRSTKKEVLAEVSAIKVGLKSAKSRSNSSLSAAIDEYIKLRENVLSPSTVRGYRCIQVQRFKALMDTPVSAIDAKKAQEAVNIESKLCNAKTLHNAWGFVSSVIYYNTGERIQVRLPQVIHDDLPYLTPQQIPIFCDAIRGLPVEVPALLGLSGLRRSEIFGLTWNDIDLVNDKIYIRESAVLNTNHVLEHKKTTKNKSSRRVIPFIIPQLKIALSEVTDKSGSVVSCGVNTICKRINAVCRKNNLPEVGVHGLRRSFCSLAYHLGISEMAAMKIGGWSDYQTMRKIYTKLSQEDLDKQSDVFKNFF